VDVALEGADLVCVVENSVEVALGHHLEEDEHPGIGANDVVVAVLVVQLHVTVTEVGEWCCVVFKHIHLRD